MIRSPGDVNFRSGPGTGWIGERPLIAFLLFAYGISWSLWGLAW